MTQRQIDYAVARATGESLSLIRRMGFTALEMLSDEGDCEPQVLDWDSPDAQHAPTSSPLSSVA